MKFRVEIILDNNMNWQLDEWDSEIFPEDFNVANEDDAVKMAEEYLRKIDLNPDDYKIRATIKAQKVIDNMKKALPIMKTIKGL